MLDQHAIGLDIGLNVSHISIYDVHTQKPLHVGSESTTKILGNQTLYNILKSDSATESDLNQVAKRICLWVEESFSLMSGISIESEKLVITASFPLALKYRDASHRELSKN